MFDKFRFNDAGGQALSTLDITGVVSDNIWDLEEGVAVDQQILGWINGIILSSSNSSGGAEGLVIMMRSSDVDTLATTPLYLGGIRLTQAEIVAGHRFSFGINKMLLKKYAAIWYNAFSSSLDGATSVDCWFSEQPHAELGVQKKNTSSGA